MQYSPIQFKICLENPHAHLFHVECYLPNCDLKEQLFSLPSWIPGSYLIREFSKHIVNINAYSSKKIIPIKKINKNTWTCQPLENNLTLKYNVYAWDLSIRSAFLDTTKGFFNGTSLFLRPHGFENHPYEMIIETPKTANTALKLATSASFKKIDDNGFGIYTASNYEELVDHPFLMGDLDDIHFQANNIQHRLSVLGKQKGDLNKVALDLQKLCSKHIELFGEQVPFEHYTFLLRLEEDAYGGLEHRSSCALIHKPNSLPLISDTEINEQYRSLLGLFSHEYFHAWNIKKLKPKNFSLYDFNQENYTELLWFFEGFTSYYDDLLLLRSKLISPESYLQLLSKTITLVYQTPGRLKQTLAQASFDAWIKFYRADENTPNACISYYTKGSLIALALDFIIRLQTDSQKSLDDVMRLLWKHSLNSNNFGLDETNILKAVEKIAKTSLSDFFEKYIHGTEDLPLLDLFSQMGIKCYFTQRDANKCKVDLGFKTQKTNSQNDLRLSFVQNEGPAEQAGLTAGDTLVAIDNIQVTANNLDDILSRYQPDEHIQIHAFRQGVLFNTNLRLDCKPKDVCVLKLSDPITKKIEKRRENWWFGATS